MNGTCVVGTEQLAVHLVLWMRVAGVGAGCHACQAHVSHQSLSALAVKQQQGLLRVTFFDWLTGTGCTSRA